MILIQIILYYLVLGSMFTLSMANDISRMIDSMRVISGEELDDFTDKELINIVVVLLTVLWPYYMYQVYLRNKGF